MQYCLFQIKNRKLHRMIVPVKEKILETTKSDLHHVFSVPVIVAALGYFVDIYDLLLFGIVRIPVSETWV
jgi:hypothetical protein